MLIPYRFDQNPDFVSIFNLTISVRGASIWSDDYGNVIAVGDANSESLVITYEGWRAFVFFRNHYFASGSDGIHINPVLWSVKK
jgi:hypothetical protein